MFKRQGEQLQTLIESQKAEIDKFDGQINESKKNEIAAIKTEWDTLSKDLGKLDKDLIDKQSTLKNVDKQVKESDAVQKKLARFIEDM